jgi:hypothetical protein
MCPSNGDEKTVQSFIIEHGDAIVALAAGTLPEGVVSCSAVLGACLSRPRLLKTGQTLFYGTGSDGDLQKGDARSFTDEGDGTITDDTTGLMWEKKSRDGSIHDWSMTYTWCVDVSPNDNVCDNGTDDMDGTMVTTFLATLNGGGGFAGHTDWRIPNVNELLSIVNYQYHDPAVYNAFNTNCVDGCTVTTCSCTADSSYTWSSTTLYSYAALGADFTFGFVAYRVKANDKHFVRAVRGGS